MLFPASFCKFAMGYAYLYQTDLPDSLILLQNMQAGRPIYISGRSEVEGQNNTIGHAWVIDGALKRTRNIYLPSIPDPILVELECVLHSHCNWGWGGNFDGYYLHRAFSVRTYLFDKTWKCVINEKEIFNMEDFNGLISGILPVNHIEKNRPYDIYSVSGVKIKNGHGIYIQDKKKMLKHW